MAKFSENHSRQLTIASEFAIFRRRGLQLTDNKRRKTWQDLGRS